MKVITKPVGVSVILTIILILCQFTSYREIGNLLFILQLLVFGVLFIHELGHALLGVRAGYRFNYLKVGLLSIENMGELQIKVNNSWIFIGGVTSCTPLTSDMAKLVKQHWWFVFGGPLFSVLFVIGSLLANSVMESEFLIYFAIIHAVIATVTLLPFKGSDGEGLYQLYKGGSGAERYVASLLLMKEFLTPLHPKEWSEDALHYAKCVSPSEDNIAALYMLFYHTFVLEGYEAASALVRPFKEIPVTKANKIEMQFATHLRQIHCLVQGGNNRKHLYDLHKQLTPIEPISYKRSQAILAKLDGDDARAERLFTQITRDIHKGKRQFGFYFAEELLTEFVKKQIGLTS
ncbi:hypothetical protein N781_03120 [Pontibacillus halophilus JSM 076056 = DSM 19796]|uniref:Peptidase M50 domain-containing protein n=1 Tax=Pontibacillus halophilus JSM 076056 = DSM 19796 TaxID=1385510 RepID=A0A0A5GFS0_9BACI|nr:hypothetical protein [Pontibacillus halophilus]KGX92086.1 hypothetical protein N781_03120 [Pontibacillus halophilus JSM 076056 = DSM 19796]